MIFLQLTYYYNILFFILGDCREAGEGLPLVQRAPAACGCLSEVQTSGGAETSEGTGDCIAVENVCSSYL